MKFLKAVFISLLIIVLLPFFCFGEYVLKDGKNLNFFPTEKEIDNYLQQKGYHKKLIDISTKGKDVIYSIEDHYEKRKKYFNSLIASINIDHIGNQRLRFNLSKPKGKIKKLKEAVTYNPKQWSGVGFHNHLYYWIGHLYFNLKDYKNATYYLNKGNPNINDYCCEDDCRNYLLAESYRKLGNIKTALKHYEYCINQGNIGEFGSSDWNDEKSSDWNKQQRLRHNIKIAFFYCNYVLENKVVGRHDFIKKYLFKIIENAQYEGYLNWHLGKAHFLLSKLYYVLRDFKQSEEEIKKAEFFGFKGKEVISLKKNLDSLEQIDGLLAKAKDQKLQKNYEKAIKYCEEILKIDENNPSAFNLLALVIFILL